MTQIGKVLVFVNLGFSLMMAAWAVSLYANRIDWSSNAAGELKARTDKITQANGALALAQGRWRDAAADLARLDERRATNLKYYAAELDHLRTKATDRDPGRRVRVAEGVIVLVEPRLSLSAPAMDKAVERGGAPLQSLKYYAEQYDVLQKDIADQTKRFKDLVLRDQELTAELVGPRGDAGLRTRLRGESVKRVNLVKEFDDLRPVLGNTLVESDLLLKRQRQLQYRIAELESVGVAAGRP